MISALVQCIHPNCEHLIFVSWSKNRDFYYKWTFDIFFPQFVCIFDTLCGGVHAICPLIFHAIFHLNSVIFPHFTIKSILSTHNTTFSLVSWSKPLNTQFQYKYFEPYYQMKHTICSLPHIYNIFEFSIKLYKLIWIRKLIILWNASYSFGKIESWLSLLYLWEFFFVYA